MAESICRVLRDGCLEGEHAPALTIKDSVHIPFGSHAFNYILCHLSSNISALRSQARGLVLVAFDRSPSFYFDLLKSRGINADKWIQILDCYSDPLGWKDRLVGPGSCAKFSAERRVTPFKDVRDMEKLFTSIIDLGRGVVEQGKVRFSVAIDSVSAMLRHASLPSISGLLSNLRSNDLHEVRAVASVEYMSSIVASLEPLIQSMDGQQSHSGNLLLLEQNSRGGKFNVRMKRRNGRVRVICEEFHMEQAGIKFVAVSSGNVVINQTLLPKVQFNLQLSEKERVDRANVILPFEHQENGKAEQIYDGRRSLSEDQSDPHPIRSVLPDSQLITEANSGKGEIHYIRDSDDEQLDSDEDPDDDLDI
ncbi:elongator complex protein 5 isoform X2 [Magnolia sinica]|uniref:elongator complex protein 5 isoform X2 n=1 Tax=Magnolia sinica TaxID=86752 RepID=UPI002657FE5C|nr:elongator complex protein 5 isoform X2 [Magnolia sinica]